MTVLAMDASDLPEQAQLVVEARTRPTLMDEAERVVDLMIKIANHWGDLSAAQRDLVGHVAMIFAGDPPRPSFVSRWRFAWQVGRMSREGGFEHTLRRLTRFRDRVQEFVSIVFHEQELANEELQAHLADLVNTAAEAKDLKTISRDEVDGWIAGILR